MTIPVFEKSESWQRATQIFGGHRNITYIVAGADSYVEVEQKGVWLDKIPELQNLSRPCHSGAPRPCKLGGVSERSVVSSWLHCRFSDGRNF